MARLTNDEKRIGPLRWWRFHRFSLYQPDGTHFYTQYSRDREKLGGGMEASRHQREAEEKVGKVMFKIRDFDGELINVTTHIEEREWLFGEKWCSWLSWFRKPKIVRSLDLQFSSEIGREKGSWHPSTGLWTRRPTEDRKGGTIGHGITMLDGETPERAFRRYCEQEHRSKNGKYKIEFVECNASRATGRG